MAKRNTNKAQGAKSKSQSDGVNEGGIDAHTFKVTFFRDQLARTAEVRDFTLPQLGELIRTTTAASKKTSPWLKLATFGNKHGCLRTNENMADTYGVEGDKDKKSLSFTAALELMRKARIRCLLYTTPSHVPGDNERWRILVPFSQAQPKKSRYGFLARINGLLNGQLEDESFTLSQAYHFGKVRKAPDFQVEVLDGDFIDLRDDLDVGAIGRGGDKQSPQSRRSNGVRLNTYPPADPAEVEYALSQYSSDDYWVWLRTAAGLNDEFGEDGFAMFDSWSAKATEKYSEKETQEKWDKGVQTMTAVGIGTVYYFAEQASPGWRHRYQEAKAQADGVLVLARNKIDWGRAVKAKLWPGLRYWRQDFYIFKDGAYRMIKDEVIEAEVTLELEQSKMKMSEELRSFDAKKANVAEAMQAIKVTSIIPPNIEDGSWIDGATGPTDVIVFPNGRLDLETGELLPPDAQFFATSSLGFDWVPDPGPAIDFVMFLHGVFGGDYQQIELMLEILGYCLTTDCSLQKAFMILGPKRSGKGTIMRVLGGLLGPGAIHSIPLKKFGRTFGLQGAIGKRVILIADARIGGRADQNDMTENVLKISGGDPLSIDRKYKDDWDGCLTAKIIALANIMPKIGDDSGVVVSRFTQVRTQVSFFGRENLTLFKDKLEPELPAILCLCIRALQDLRQRGHFQETEVGVEAQQEMADLSNPTGAFVRQTCGLHRDAWIYKDELYNAYTRWCADNNEWVLPKAQFLSSLYASFPDELRPVRPRPGKDAVKPENAGGRPGVIAGIKLIPVETMETATAAPSAPTLNNLSANTVPFPARKKRGGGTETQ